MRLPPVACGSNARIVPCMRALNKRSRRYETSSQRNRLYTMPPMVRKPGRSAVQLDDVSKAIIEQLQQDGPRSYAAIGKVVGLSEAAVRQRVQRLVDNGVMQVVAVTEPLQLGFSRQAMIGVKATGDLESVADALVTMEEVDYVVVVAGSFDLLVEVVAESDEHLLTIVSKRIRAIP